MTSKTGEWHHSSYFHLLYCLWMVPAAHLCCTSSTDVPGWHVHACCQKSVCCYFLNRLRSVEVIPGDDCCTSPLEGHQSSSRTGIRSYRMTSNSHFWFYDQTNWNRLDEGQMAFNGTSGYSSAPCSLPGIATRKAGLSLVLFLSRASSHWAHDRH